MTLLPNVFGKHQCHNTLLECNAKLFIENTIKDPELKTLCLKQGIIQNPHEHKQSLEIQKHIKDVHFLQAEKTKRN